ncbi:MAG: hypothetical protein ABUS79_02625 [Pseudomonadota bacterium]
MSGLPVLINRARPAVARFAVAAVVAIVVPACRTPPTQIVLVVDTNLAKVDLDEVKIIVSAGAGMTVDGSTPAADAATSQPLDIPLTAPGAPTFPLTLGIEPSGPPGDLEVSVQGLLEGNVVVEQSATTAFVTRAQKMLEMLLLDSCVGTACPGTATPQTCKAGLCDTASMDGPELPSWTGSLPPRPTPSPTTPIGGRMIWANGWHSCANEGPLLYCWGRNTDGEIGDGTTVNAKTRHPVMKISDPVAVGLGQVASCVCDQAEKAWCWGGNVEGQLGIGAASVSSPTPVQVHGIDNCVQIAGGASHSCAVHGPDGSVSCWGANNTGQAGQPASAATSCAESKGTTATPCVLSPALVAGLTNVAEVRAGDQYTCARKNDLTVWCWGENTYGALGDGTNTSRSTPAVVVGLDKDVVEIATGRQFACARHQAGTVSCWGRNDSGQLGNGLTTDTNRPVAVVGITDAVQLGAGQYHTCALRGLGLVSCWGGNRDGQLGNGTMTSSLAPVEVDARGVGPLQSIAVGSNHTCARSASGPAFCWGRNDVDEIGDSTTTYRPQPVSVPGFI